jgi:hypothetical protein
VKLPRYLCGCVLVALAPIGAALAQQPACRVEPIQGATSPQGTIARMRVVNTGSSCAIVNHGVPAERGNPADSGKITKQPAHGKAEFVAPHARYTPDQGYVGEDEFEYEAFARGRSNQQVRLRVQVKVLVVAP